MTARDAWKLAYCIYRARDGGALPSQLRRFSQAVQYAAGPSRDRLAYKYPGEILQRQADRKRWGSWAPGPMLNCRCVMVPVVLE